eukprot:CAMPEP_0117754292 /NCGR_PEP_ID=MMETSP0947-20121206/12745_1 /TAXON_ID=44440 /ORGANISM="Chattonella subsalsa, Strain CCMP2191" /LENGTH=853 /DNA_ID=CAMNT_0005573359 /DNA_START=595 /DNA_END=3156 /DNA_ORIENTATION=-
MQTARVKVLDTTGTSLSSSTSNSLKILETSLANGGFPSEVVMETWTPQDFLKGDSPEFEDGSIVVSFVLEGLDSHDEVQRARETAQLYQPLQTAVNIQDGTLSLILPNGTDVEAVSKHLEKRGYPSLSRSVEIIGQSSNDVVATMLQRQQRISPLEKFQRQELTVQRDLRQGVVLLASSVAAHLTHHLEEFAVALPHALDKLLNGLYGIGFLVGTPFQAFLAVLSFVGPGRSIIMDGWKAIFERKDPNMNTLLSLGAVSSFGSSVAAFTFPQLGWGSHFSDPIMIFGFILVGQALEARARLRSARGLQKLFDLQVQRCTLVNEADNSISQVDVNSLPIGAVVRVLPGERIPIDGTVVSGQSAVAEGLLTGESMPIAKRQNDKVAAGTVNIDGPLEVRATKLPANSLLNQIIGMVEDAQSRQAPIQSVADRIAGKFCWGVLGTAGLTTLFWGSLGSSLFPRIMEGVNSWAMATRLACDVMIVSCPCSLGLATPIAILVGSSIAAERGILIKGADILEKSKEISTVVFDKTGTLTTGNPTVEKIVPLVDSHTELSVLETAAAVEWGTTHPLALAIQSAAMERGIKSEDANATNYRTYPGLGASASVDGHHVAIGNVALMDQEGVETEHGDRAHHLAHEFGHEGLTAIYIAVDGQLVGLIGASDELRPEAIEVMKSLKDQGINVRLLTGDRKEVANATAHKLGLHSYEVIANVKPARKALTIKRLQGDGRVVAMIGDGINDAPALAQADVGIALRAGTDVAFRAADAVLMRDSLKGVEDLMKISNNTLKKVRSNLLLALGYNVVAIPLAAGVGLPFGGAALSPSMAAVMHSAVSLLVISNSIFLGKRLKDETKKMG